MYQLSDYPTEPNTAEELSKLQREYGQECRVIGARSNLLIPDEGIDGVVVRSGKGFRYSKTLFHKVSEGMSQDESDKAHSAATSA